MNKNLTLESLRGFACIYVVIGHWLLSVTDINSIVKFLFSFGQEAVIVFFIVSGYVIQISWHNDKNKSLKTYFIKRFRRIYFPFVISLLVSTIINPHLFSFRELIGNLLMLQDFETGKPGTLVNPFSGNSPLWSLSYEWGFYLIFPLLFPILERKSRRIYFVGAQSIIFLIIYIFVPNHLFLIPAYLIIWWAGLELASLKLNKLSVSFCTMKPLFIILSIMTAILIIFSFNLHTRGVPLRPGIYPFLFLRHFGFTMFFLLFIVYFKRTKNIIARILVPFSRISPISYSLYIFHYIILVQLQTPFPLLAEITFKVTLLLALCYVTEIKLQPIINKTFR